MEKNLSLVPFSDWILVPMQHLAVLAEINPKPAFQTVRDSIIKHYWCSDQNMARWLWCCIQSDLFKTQLFKPILLPQWKEPQSYLFTYHFWCIIQEHVWCLWHKNPAYAQFKAMQKCYNSGSCIASCPRIETYESIFLESLWQYTHKNSSTSFLFVPDVQKSQLE